MVDKIDEKINKLFEVVRKQKEEVEAAEKEAKQSWKTKCSIVVPFARDDKPVNLQTATEPVLKNVVIGLLKHRDYNNEAEQLLGIERADKYEGFTYEDWFADCKKRITMLNLKTKKEKLALAEQGLNAIVSPEQRRAMELERITASLGI